ncbi:hypothetical protein EDB85DRAFT_2000628 [Lactarius pseudohatsudake]|nr:hypothetical protein EDB85DRAFT_2000628 [Lactarius pseudohatsudake]
MPGQQPQHNAPPDADANNNIRYGRIPQRVPRRNKTLKRVDLFHGNTVFSFFAMPYQAKSLRPLPCAVFTPSYPFTTVAAAITTTTACRLRATPVFQRICIDYRRPSPRCTTNPAPTRSSMRTKAMVTQTTKSATAAPHSTCPAATRPPSASGCSTATLSSTPPCQPSCSISMRTKTSASLRTCATRPRRVTPGSQQDLGQGQLEGGCRMHRQR